MDTEPSKTLWRDYVLAVSGEYGKGSGISRQIRERMGQGPNQSTIDRWLKAETIPTNAGDVAWFARAFGRNPIEAFLAAGMLTDEEAARALEPQSLTLIRDLERNPMQTIIHCQYQRTGGQLPTHAAGRAGSSRYQDLYALVAELGTPNTGPIEAAIDGAFANDEISHMEVEELRFVLSERRRELEAIGPTGSGAGSADASTESLTERRQQR